MLNDLTHQPSRSLDEDQYIADADAELEKLDGDFLKLERRQTFQEPWDRSWEAMVAGRWERSLDLLDAARSEIKKELETMRSFRRVRVIEHPFSPYLQWELNLFAIRFDLGEEIRVVRADKIRDIETKTLLPEIIILGSGPMYEIVYDSAGLHRGGRRFDDGHTIRHCRSEIEELFTEGEEFPQFFEREVRPLPPPRIP
jgi:hypothetical protein